MYGPQCGNKPELTYLHGTEGMDKTVRGWEDSIHAGTCFPCHFDCQLCAGPEAHHCTKCKPNLKPAFIPNPTQGYTSAVFKIPQRHGTCHYHCPDGMYLDKYAPPALRTRHHYLTLPYLTLPYLMRSSTR